MRQGFARALALTTTWFGFSGEYERLCVSQSGHHIWRAKVTVLFPVSVNTVFTELTNNKPVCILQIHGIIKSSSTFITTKPRHLVG